jgi:uncharacterized protein involved in outer membrane biogenesis
MSKSLKVILFIVGGLIGLLVLVAAGLLFFVDFNAYKPRLETAASEALGMEVRIGGRLGIAFFPGLRVTLEDVQIRNRRTDLAAAKEIKLGIDLLPLLYREVRIRKIGLESPTVSIERNSDANFNFDKLKETQKLFPALDGATVSFSGGTFRYANKQSGKRFEAVGCNLNLSDLRLASGESPDLLKHLSFAAEAACGEIRAKEFAVSDIKFSVAGKDGVFDLKPVTLSIFGGQGSGNIRADFSGPVPRYHIRCSLPQFRIEDFLKTLSPKAVAEGSMDFSADLTVQGKTATEMKESAEGNASLRGRNLTIEGRNLDAEFSRYESSQNFNLVDVGAFFLAGPVGLAVTKGYSFTSIFIFQGSDGSSTIRTLVSDWKVERGVARAQDAAMATNENRIALQGGLDFVNERFDDMIIALIDAQGCAKVRQKIHGPFQKPVVEKPNILTSLAGPALSLLKQGKDLLPGGECERFYSGSVAPPR